MTDSVSLPQLKIVVATLLAGLQLSSCGTTLGEVERYEKDALQAERMDKIRGSISACFGAGHTVVYYGPKKHKLIDPIKRIPRNAHVTDYSCVSKEDLERVLRGS